MQELKSSAVNKKCISCGVMFDTRKLNTNWYQSLGWLKRPVQLTSLTYPEFYRWWRSATPAEQKKASSTAAIGQVLVSKRGQ